MAKKRVDLQGIWDFRLVFVSLTAPHAFPQATRRHIFDVPSHSQTMPIAFKEWAVTVRALAEGEQLVTLRKGLSQQSEKPFRLDGNASAVGRPSDAPCLTVSPA